MANNSVARTRIDGDVREGVSKQTKVYFSALCRKVLVLHNAFTCSLSSAHKLLQIQ